jgi:hypothetical protein
MARNVWLATVNTDPRGITQDGLTLATFTTAASIFPDVTVPGNFFSRGRGLYVKARGIWAATRTPTYTFSLKVGSVVVVTSAAITVSALTNQAWELEISVKTTTEGTAGTLLAMGDLAMGGVTGDIFLPATGTAPANSGAIDLTSAQAIAIQIACSASSASNTVKGIVEKLVSYDFA